MFRFDRKHDKYNEFKVWKRCALTSLFFFAEMQSEQAHSATIYPRVHHAHHPETYKVSDTY